MIQELLGGEIGVGVSGSGADAERKIHVSGGTSIAIDSSSSSSSSSEQQNLRCPRCDSAKTKFCYYNNYNLTQPRHFCKTCRRYWTKGGALRNVPIGGGCRKNKSSAISTVVGKAATPGKGARTSVISTDVCRTNLGSGFDHNLASNPILWPAPHNSQLMALLRAAQNPNPNHILNSVVIKDEVGMLGSNMVSESALTSSGLCSRTLSLDPMAQGPTGLCSSIWRSNQPQQQLLQPQNPLQHNVILGHEAPNGGIQDLYQRLRSSASYYTTHPPILSNLASSSTTAVLSEPSPTTAGELGYWNSTLQWSDLSTTNGAFP